MPGDVGSEAGCRALAEQIAAQEDRLHVLVNNAGANWGAPLAEYPDAAFDKVLALEREGRLPPDALPRCRCSRRRRATTTRRA